MPAIWDTQNCSYFCSPDHCLLSHFYGISRYWLWGPGTHTLEGRCWLWSSICWATVRTNHSRERSNFYLPVLYFSIYLPMLNFQWGKYNLEINSCGEDRCDMKWSKPSVSATWISQFLYEPVCILEGPSLLWPSVVLHLGHRWHCALANSGQLHLRAYSVGFGKWSFSGFGIL